MTYFGTCEHCHHTVDPFDGSCDCERDDGLYGCSCDGLEQYRLEDDEWEPAYTSYGSVTDRSRGGGVARGVM